MSIEHHLKSLNENRQRVWAEANRFLDDVATRGGDMNAEERAQWDRYNERINEIDDTIRTFADREQREREGAVTRQAMIEQFGPGVFGNSDSRGMPVREDAEADRVRRMLSGDPNVREIHIPLTGARRERELIRQGASPAEVRALAWDTGSVASAVPTTLSRSLYEYLEASVALYRMPTTKFDTSSGEPMHFPRVASHAIATQVAGQGTALAGTDPSFGRLQLDAFKYGELVRVANEVVQDTAIDILAWLGKDMGRAIGRVVATDLVTGSGTGKPNGAMNALAGGGAGSVTTGGSLINPTYETLVDLQYAVNDAYRGPDTAWLMRDSTGGTIRKLRDGGGGTLGRPIWEPSQTSGMVNGQPDRLLGYPVYTDPNVASLASNARIMAFGDWSAYFIRHVGGVTIERDTSRYFDTDETAVRAKWRLDGDLQDYNALVTMVRNV